MILRDFSEAVRYFRRFESVDSIERVIDRLCENAADDKFRLMIMSAADHRRAEIANRQLFNPGEVPGWAWAAVE
ncbi:MULTISPECIES: Hha/YmoA family nucleoid-associated regulatory protein [Aeromonas]|uniref:Hha/YmoA family nucleoid-associated regulatory protein n=1 Tax=Aeromonas TaxID=642 RepID=UPI001CC72C6B